MRLQTFVVSAALILLGCSQAAVVGLEPLPDSGTDAGRSARPDAGAPTRAPQCVSACDAFAEAGCITARELGMCVEACADADLRPMVVECISAADGCALSPGCEAARSSELRDDCRRWCTRLVAFDCIPAVDSATCAGACDTEPTALVERFNDCAAPPGSCSDDACYRIFVPAGASPDRGGCLTACDRMQFFDCLDAFQHESCRMLCGEADRTSIQNFTACARELCSDDECFFVFQSAAGSDR